MKPITPCLWFDGRAEEAAAFYCSVFPDSEILGRTHYGPEFPDAEGTVLTVSFRVNGRTFTGLNGGPQFPFTEAVSFEVHCDTDEELHRFYDALVDGGRAAPCGWVTDRFGLSWQVIPPHLLEWMESPDREAAGRVIRATLGTHGKLDPDVLRAAYEGRTADV